MLRRLDSTVRFLLEAMEHLDSLGEAYMKAGEKELAIQNYEKSLQLDPKNLNAVEMLRKLKEMK